MKNKTDKELQEFSARAVSKIAVQFNFGWKAKVYLKCLTVLCIITMREPDYDKVVERLVKLADTKVIPVNE